MPIAIYPSRMSFLMIVILMSFLHSSQAHIFDVGGEAGWTLRPTEYYIRWARRNRFQINDELNFRYKKNHDSVLVVSKDDYKKCNKDNPIQALKDGNNSTFKFERSGPFFFISGHDQNCEKGQKFIVVVLSNHHHHNRRCHITAPSLLPAQNPLLQPCSSPSSPSPSPSASSHPVKPHSNSPSPSPASKPPKHAPSPYPESKTPPHHNHEPHSHSPSPSTTTKTPTTHDTPPLGHSPLPSPVPNDHSPNAKPPNNSNAPQPHHHHHAPYPHASYPHHYAPAPAPSSAPSYGTSFVQIVWLGLVASLIYGAAGFV